MEEIFKFELIMLDFQVSVSVNVMHEYSFN
jgi:hypothetical protein